LHFYTNVDFQNNISSLILFNFQLWCKVEFSWYFIWKKKKSISWQILSPPFEFPPLRGVAIFQIWKCSLDQPALWNFELSVSFFLVLLSSDLVQTI